MATGKRTRVAIVVFADVPADDIGDADLVAAAAIRARLTGDATRPLPVWLPVPLRGVPDDVTVRIVEVTEVGVAAGNGSLWVHPTARAWNDRGLDD